jgi:polysaccharide export outer membrane protein
LNKVKKKYPIIDKKIIFATMKKIIASFICSILLISCANKKDIIYYQDIDKTELQNISQIKPKIYIQVGDILNIDLKTLNQESLIPFLKNANANQSTGSQQLHLLKIKGYLVDENGYIYLPVIDKVKVDGLTTREAEKLLKNKLSNYLKDPFVSIRIINFKFTVSGEVNKPGTYEISEPNFTLLQALNMAGDLNIRGRRDNIMIIRSEADKRITKRIDLTKSDWMNSPFYFIKQNDVIYVEPNNPQVKTAGFIGNVGVLTSVASIVLSAIVIITR